MCWHMQEDRLYCSAEELYKRYFDNMLFSDTSWLKYWRILQKMVIIDLNNALFRIRKPLSKLLLNEFKMATLSNIQ